MAKENDDGSQGSLIIIPNYISYEEDEGTTHYTEHPAMSRIIGPLDYQMIRRASTNLASSLKNAGVIVQVIDAVDD